MDVNAGRSYHIKDSFFSLVSDPNLSQTKRGIITGRIFSFFPMKGQTEYTGLFRKVQELKSTNQSFKEKFRNTENATQLLSESLAEKRMPF